MGATVRNFAVCVRFADKFMYDGEHLSGYSRVGNTISNLDNEQLEAILKPGCRFNKRLYLRVILSYRGF